LEIHQRFSKCIFINIEKGTNNLLLKNFSIIFFGLLLFLNKVSSQTCDFSFTSNSGTFCNPQAINFINKCTGNPEGYIWSFGNGEFSTNPTEVITYLNPGTYTVTLTATFANSALTTSKTITINSSPTVNLTADKNIHCKPSTITFTANASNNTTKYEWNFGDSSGNVTTNTNTTNHYFSNFRTYNVTVNAITNNGCKASKTILIKIDSVPIIATLTPDSGCIPITSIFTATDTLLSGDNVLKYDWTFGDGGYTTTTTNTTSHLYNTTNTINNASVKITTTDGCTNTFKFRDFGFGTPPINTNLRTSNGKDTFCGGNVIPFQVFTSKANYYIWNFGDGTILKTRTSTASHKYISLGDKYITVVPYFNGCVGQTDTIKITIIGVIANYTFTNDCTNKNVFTYTNTSAGLVSKFKWSFNNTTQIDSINLNQIHTWPKNAVNTTSLYVYDSITGCSDTYTSNQYTSTPVLTTLKNAVCKDSVQNYIVTSSYSPKSGFLYEFHIQDSIVQTDTINYLKYNSIKFGTFQDFVIISNPAGNTCSDTIFLSGPTKVGGPIPNFSTIAEQCRNIGFPVTDQSTSYFSTDSIVKWKWFYDDGAIEYGKNVPPHIYTSPGTYNLHLFVTDNNNCTQKIYKPVNAQKIPYIKTLPRSKTICLGEETTLRVYTIDTLLWKTNVAISCITCDSVTVKPSFTTTYIAQAKDSVGCYNTDSSIVIVNRPFKLSAFPADTSVCPQLPVNLSLSQKGITKWSPSTYLSANNIPNPISKPDTTIIYSVSVVDNKGCFSDSTKIKINTFKPAKLDAGPDLKIIYKEIFTLKPTYTTSPASYLWNPIITGNNLNCYSCAFPRGVANKSETYTIQIKSKDGCLAKDTVAVFVDCEKANLYVPNSFSPNNDGVNDIFFPSAYGYKIINKFSVFNRWGQKVFEQKEFAPGNINFGWNGKTKNLDSQTETYVWYIEATCDIGEKIMTKGTVVLVR
jgi:gliding motility-associated-like protein